MDKNYKGFDQNDFKAKLMAAALGLEPGTVDEAVLIQLYEATLRASAAPKEERDLREVELGNMLIDHMRGGVQPKWVYREAEELIARAPLWPTPNT